MFADIVWLASSSVETAHVGDAMPMNFETLDFSPLLEFLVGTADP